MCALKNNSVERKPTLKLLIHNLTAQFLPASLIEKATYLSNSQWLMRETDDKFIIYLYINE